jgi:hypothetical protein
VQKLASLEFEELLPVSGDDEMQELASSINRMALDLQSTTKQIRITERTSLVTQVAGGLAHQLRNSITGAQMAVQLHLRRCRDTDKESLRVALLQLSLTENQIRGLLRLTRDAQQPPVPGCIDGMIQTIRDLLAPQCQHSEIGFSVTFPSPEDCGKLTVSDAEPIQASLLNLMQNAVEACGPGGQVQVIVALQKDEALSNQSPHNTGSWICVDVLDNGPGVNQELDSRIFEPFVTGKPEGVGLGLTLASQTADDHGGSLTFERVGEWTRFRFRIPTQRL